MVPTSLQSKEGWIWLGGGGAGENGQTVGKKDKSPPWDAMGQPKEKERKEVTVPTFMLNIT
jgi:hypothetical protein